MTDNQEVFFDQSEIIVSKTDPKGHILYANDVFCRLSEMTSRELVGQPHSIIRHQDMPRSIFKYMWSELEAGREVFAYVKNSSKTGKFYWVFAHVTPSFAASGNIVGFHSNRRAPKKEAIDAIAPVYATLRDIENGGRNRKTTLEASYEALHTILDEHGKTYSEFVWSLGGA